MELRQTAERERILQVAGHARLPQPAAREQLAQARRGRLQPRRTDAPGARRAGSTGWRRTPPCPVLRRRPARPPGACSPRPPTLRSRSRRSCCRPSPCPRRPRAGIRPCRSARQPRRPSAPDRPDRPSRAFVSRSASRSFSACTTSSASSGRTPAVARARLFASRSSVPRTTSSLAGGPWPTRQFMTSSRLNRCDVLRVEADPLERAGAGREAVDRRTLGARLLEHAPRPAHAIDRRRGQRDSRLPGGRRRPPGRG